MTELIFGRSNIVGKLRYYFLDRNYSLTLRVFLISVCLLLTLACTVLLAAAAITNNYVIGLLPIAPVIAVIGLILVYRNLERIGLLILTMTMVVSAGIPTGTGTKITFSLILLNLWVIVWLFKMLVVDRSFAELRPAPANRFALAFIIWMLVSFVWSAIFVDQAVSYLYASKLFPRLMTLDVIAISVATYFIYANQIRSEGAFRFIIWLFILVGLGFGVLWGIFKWDMVSPLNAHGQFPAWVGAICAGQLLFNRQLKQWMRLALLGICGLWLYITIGIGFSWLSGWLPLCCCIAGVAALYSRKLLIILLVVGGTFYAINKITISADLQEEQQVSGDTRQAAWATALDTASQHLIFGTGPAGYAFYYSTYLTGFYQFSHNNYIDIIAQTGIVGLVIWIGFWVAAAYSAYRAYQVVPRGTMLHGLGATCLAVTLTLFVVMMLGDWVTPFTYTQTLAGVDYTIWAWILSGLSVALYYYCQNHYSPTTNALGEYKSWRVKDY
jgi:O-antigen ligase